MWVALLLLSAGVQAGRGVPSVQRGNREQVANAVQSSATASREMTLVTLNLHHDREDWPARRAYIARELKRLAPDVIALQEVIERRGSVENQAAWLARELGYDYTFASVDPVGAPKRYGNALLSRRKVLATHQRLLAREARILFEAPYAEGRWASDHYGVWVRLQLAPEHPASNRMP